MLIPALLLMVNVTSRRALVLTMRIRAPKIIGLYAWIILGEYFTMSRAVFPFCCPSPAGAWLVGVLGPPLPPGLGVLGPPGLGPPLPPGLGVLDPPGLGVPDPPGLGVPDPPGLGPPLPPGLGVLDSPLVALGPLLRICCSPIVFTVRRRRKATWSDRSISK